MGCFESLIDQFKVHGTLRLIFYFMLSGRISRNIDENIFQYNYAGTTSENTDFYVLVA